MFDAVLDAISSVAHEVISQFGTSWRQLGRILVIARYGWIIAFALELPLVATFGGVVIVAGVLWEFSNVLETTGNTAIAAAWAVAVAIYVLLVAAGLRIAAKEIGGLSGLFFAGVILMAAIMFDQAFISEIASVLR